MGQGESAVIISISRRTDIPAFYGEWLMRRVEEGFADTRNPMNPAQIRRVRLRPEQVDGLVFWTKNPAPMLDKLPLLREYAYYFQFTLNGYGTDVEQNLPREQLPDIFRRLSDMIGPERLIWRYDPILFNMDYNPGWHLENFAALAKTLEGYTQRCVISFYDHYRKIEARMRPLRLIELPKSERIAFAQKLAEIAKSHGIAMACCAEDLPLPPAACIDALLLSQIAGRLIPAVRDRNQRPGCVCSASVDIGAYNTCRNGCLYCYANHSEASIEQRVQQHRLESTFLVGE